MSIPDTLSGKLLVAMPNMTDPRFNQAVVFILNHDETHAFGVVVNNPHRNVALGDVLNALEIDLRPEIAGERVFDGGPMQKDRGVVLHTLDYVTEATFTPIKGNIGISGDDQVLRDVAGPAPTQPPPSKSLFIVGSSSWGAGQLENEIAANVWLHLDADDDLIFTKTPENSWRRALKSLNVTEAMFSAEWSDVRDDDALLN